MCYFMTRPVRSLAAFAAVVPANQATNESSLDQTMKKYLNDLFQPVEIEFGFTDWTLAHSLQAIATKSASFQRTRFHVSSRRPGGRQKPRAHIFYGTGGDRTGRLRPGFKLLVLGPVMTGFQLGCHDFDSDN